MTKRLHCHICQKLRQPHQLEMIDPWRNEKRGGKQLHLWICCFCIEAQNMKHRLVASTRSNEEQP